jgi:hypothetical protein
VAGHEIAMFDSSGKFVRIIGRHGSQSPHGAPGHMGGVTERRYP